MKGAAKRRFECESHIQESHKLDNFLRLYDIGFASFDKTVLIKSKEHIKNMLLKSDGALYVLDEAGIVGACSLRKLEWDANLFGYPCASIDFYFCSLNDKKDMRDICSLMSAYIKKWLESNKIRFAYAKIDKRDPGSISCLESIGFKVIEEIAPFYLSLKSVNKLVEPDITFRIASQKDIPRLQEIAPQSTFNRFAKDKMFAKEEVIHLRKEWIKNLVNKSADFVILSMDNEVISGFNACDIDKNTNIGVIRLIVVDKEYAGGGIGAKLVNKSIIEFAKRNLDYVFVSTQSDNIIAHKLYSKCGFNKGHPLVTLHYWSDG